MNTDSLNRALDAEHGGLLADDSKALGIGPQADATHKPPPVTETATAGVPLRIYSVLGSYDDEVYPILMAVSANEMARAESLGLNVEEFLTAIAEDSGLDLLHIKRDFGDVRIS